MKKAALNLADQVTVAMGQPLGAGGALVAILIEVLPDVINAILEDCNKTPEEVAEIAKNPTRLQRMKLRRRYRRELGREDFKEAGGEQLVLATEKVASRPENLELIKQLAA